MRRFLSGLSLAAIILAAATPTVVRADPAADDVAALIRPLMAPASPYAGGVGWTSLDAVRAVRWGQGPVMMDRPSPDGNFFARPGQATIAGRPAAVVASGARTMVFSIYVRDTGPPVNPEAVAGALRAARFGVTTARCPQDPRSRAPHRWYKLTASGKRPAFLEVGPLKSGAGGYTLYLDDLPPMTQGEAQLYTDACAEGGQGPAPGTPAARPTTGQAGVTAAIEALLRPAGAASSIPWSGLVAIPGVAWKSAAPMKMSNPWTDAGQDRNSRLLEGEFKSATTKMVALATGDDRAANQFQLRQGRNLPRGAVFAALTRDGYTMTPLRCGKVYTQTSQAWYRITGPGKQPAILYRALHTDGGLITEDYGLRLDNVLPPAEPGQTPASPRGCPAPQF